MIAAQSAHECVHCKKGYFPAEAQRSRRKILCRVTQTHALPFSLFRVLCALSVSVVRFCSALYPPCLEHARFGRREALP